jgi:hypothetical protein
MIQKPRPESKGSRGGRVGLVIADRINCGEMSSDELKYVTFEAMMVRIQLKNPLLLVILYRPPPSSQNKYSAKQFSEEIEDLIANSYVKHPGDVIIMGDFTSIGRNKKLKR